MSIRAFHVSTSYTVDIRVAFLRGSELVNVFLCVANLSMRYPVWVSYTVLYN